MLPSFRRALLATCVAVSLAACARGLAGTDGPVATPASATKETEPTRKCPACDVDPTRFLRQLSLDLRGRPPTVDELEAVSKAGTVAPEVIDAMLASDEFVEQARDWHKPLLWPNVDKFRISATPLLATDPGTPYRLTFSPDPELLGDGAKKHPHAVLQLTGYLNQNLRGLGMGCDDTVLYPAPATSGAQPTYAVVGSDGVKRTHPYYDERGVPLPYRSAGDCPNYCSSKTDAERGAPGYSAAPSDFSEMSASGADAQPHELDPSGKHCPPSHPNRVVNPCDNVPHGGVERQFRVRRDGYRKVKHYWSRGVDLTTCAYEAQARTTSASTGLACAGKTLLDTSCGCGPGGAYCSPSTGNGRETVAVHALHRAIDDEPLAIVASVIKNDEDYFSILTTRRSFVTGSLAYFFREQAGASTPFEVSSPAPHDQIPDVPYDDETWHEYVRGPEHSGVLTTVAFLTRFPTWRSRVAQVRAEFMCRPFTPAVASFPGADDPCTREPNLARRCGCQGCHVAIEPMTAWFGRWDERNARYLAPSAFPSFDPGCESCALTHGGCPPRCKPYFLDATDADAARYAGTLRAYLYRTPEEEKRIDEGPRGLVESAIATGELESCTVRTAWKQLVGRPMSDAETTELLPAMERDFDAHGRSYRALVRAIVTSPAYGRLE